ncbi:DUF6056 family protein [Listeria immobilis]|uniref:Uncharacterized protein n=1 Tax=Listeria immobilis TaxID=2713502 RepID=A0ABR6SW53_9LIST|nr:DUF6056 family protein [Listeria immobilis]MBC1482660.1 hypothetical protein [Listeria immobilis]MBC1507166.1 hypothetical protein [Listeria immobilis]MBC1509922.1 hypothetical protein [Listeria immobilis]MBC1516303.1 hypothetical protein [Listeria immobilis]MBC6302540.1 hypothetical protein [Listeria immobilis]
MIGRIKKDGFKLGIFSFIIFLFYLYLSYCTPLTHDDWSWGMQIGMNRFYDGFKDYNGRYFGNICELIITRIDWFRFLIMGVFGAAIVVLPLLIAKTAKLTIAFLSLFLMLGVSSDMFSSTFAWAAGFANYNTATICILVYLLIVKNVFYDKRPSYSVWLVIFAVPLGIASQLFVEHATIYNVFAGGFIIIYSFIKFRKIFYFHVVYFISALIGAAIMFSNGAYMKIFTGADTYRTIDTEMGFFEKIYSIFSTSMYKFLIMNNVLLNFVLAIFCIFLLVKIGTNLPGWKIWVKNIFIIILTGYPFYQPVVVNRMQLSIFTDVTKNSQLEAWMSLLFYLTILFTILLFFNRSSLKVELSFYLISAVFVAGPLFFVTPFGSRCFIISYALFVLFIVRLLVYLVDEGFVNLKVINIPIITIAICFALSYIVLFTQIKTSDNARMDSIYQQIDDGKKVVTVKPLRNEKFLWNSRLTIPSFQADNFKIYFDLPKDIELKNAPE